jgi:hypothetical protein
MAWIATAAATAVGSGDWLGSSIEIIREKQPAIKSIRIREASPNRQSRRLSNRSSNRKSQAAS